MIVADLPGIRDQVDDAALLATPDKPDSLRQAILRLINEPHLRQFLIVKGESRLAQFSDKERLSTLRNTFDAFARKRQAWISST